MWKLVIEDDEGKRTVVPLTRDDYTIGRQEGNTIRLTERNVSRSHGRVRRNRAANGNGHVFILEDMRSYNGVFVNGLRVAHTQDLQNGDLIQIGDYRIVLQDDAAQATLENATIPMLSPDPSDTKATIPVATSYRGQTLTDRPNRLVMLVGPTPGVEYPLDRERMTIGRAEDASISVNHNSVSRLHCEVHALGDGRFEIVDKASSNGVRVNAVELRRSIVEPGDVIELGDVRFKFVGAGQVFVPGPNESQQLTAISDREVDLVVNQKKGLGAYALPVIGALVIGGGVLAAALLYTHRGNHDARPGRRCVDHERHRRRRADPRGREVEVLDRRMRAGAPRDRGDLRHVALARAPPTTSSSSRRGPTRSSRRRAPIPIRRAATPTLQRVAADPKVDAAQKKRQATALMQSGDNTQPQPTNTAPIPTDTTTPSATVATPTPTNVTPPTTTHPNHPSRDSGHRPRHRRPTAKRHRSPQRRRPRPRGFATRRSASRPQLPRTEGSKRQGHAGRGEHGQASLQAAARPRLHRRHQSEVPESLGLPGAARVLARGLRARRPS